MARLGEMLVREGLVAKEQLEEALGIQKSSPHLFLGDILVRRGILSEDQLVDVMVRQSGTRSVDLDKVELVPDLKLVVTQDLAKECKCIPVKKNQNLLYLAMLDPGDTAAINRVAAVSKCTIKTLVIGPMALEKGWKRLYGNGSSASKASPDISPPPARDRKKRDTGSSFGRQMVDDVMQSAFQAAQEFEPIDDQEASSQTELVDIKSDAKSPVIRLVNALFQKAVQMNASDIHIEPLENELRVRFRIDGALKKFLSVPVSASLGVISRIKILSQMDIAEKRIPQDGRLKARFGDGELIDFRVSTLPGIYGEKVVLRILGQGELKSDISQLGLRGDSYSLVMEAIRNTYGMILVTGPTGSGKTTTLYSVLQQLNKEDVNIVTAEDPVEYHLKGITQVNIRSAIGFTFDTALRTFLRQDPDIILVGEMRDYETAAIAIKAALTGHLVLSTLHTNDCPSTVVRLVDMGIEPFMVSSAVKLVIAQRLVRGICEHCREELPVSEAERMELDESVLGSIEHLYKGKGCEKCNYIGYKGRVPIFELMPVKTQALRRVITEAGTELQVAQVARSEGLRTLREDALDLVNEGVTSLDEAIGIIIME